MSDLISRKAILKNIEKIRQHVQMMDDTRRASIIMNGMYLCEKAVSNQPSAQPEPHWIPCSERLPERIIDDDVETVQEFFVTVKERWSGEEWKYHTDIAEYPGDYIDDVWQTYNDWGEGQEVHVIAWMPLPESYKGE